MPRAYIIEVRNRTAGIIAGDEHGFRFFSSERTFDRLEGREFRSAREAERAAKALFDGRQSSASEPQVRRHILVNTVKPEEMNR
jgi:hypothetical protein